MKKVVLNISDTQYQKFILESIQEKKSVEEVIRDRIFHKPFSNTVEEYFDLWMEKELNNVLE